MLTDLSFQNALQVAIKNATFLYLLLLAVRTKTVQKSLNPVFDEFFELCNLPAGSTLVIEVWDQDVVTDDDIIGRACWQFAPKEVREGTEILAHACILSHPGLSVRIVTAKHFCDTNYLRRGLGGISP